MIFKKIIVSVSGVKSVALTILSELGMMRTGHDEKTHWHVTALSNLVANNHLFLRPFVSEVLKVPLLFALDTCTPEKKIVGLPVSFVLFTSVLFVALFVNKHGASAHESCPSFCPFSVRFDSSLHLDWA